MDEERQFEKVKQDELDNIKDVIFEDADDIEVKQLRCHVTQSTSTRTG